MNGNEDPVSEEYYVIRKDGLWVKSDHWHYVGPQITLLKEFAKQRVGQTIRRIDKKGTALFVSQIFTSLAREIKELPLDTFFRPMTDVDGKSILLPVWVAPGAEMKLKWTPPEGMVLYFVVSWSLDGGTPLEAAKAACFLVAVSDHRTHLLPLPNLYNTGQICMGKIGSINDGERSVMEQFEWALGQFEKTKWNADLIGVNGDEKFKRSQELLRFDPDGKQLPPARPWKELSGVVNYPGYEFIAALTP